MTDQIYSQAFPWQSLLDQVTKSPLHQQSILNAIYHLQDVLDENGFQRLSSTGCGLTLKNYVLKLFSEVEKMMNIAISARSKFDSVMTDLPVAIDVLVEHINALAVPWSKVMVNTWFKYCNLIATVSCNECCCYSICGNKEKDHKCDQTTMCTKDFRTCSEHLGSLNTEFYLCDVCNEPSCFKCQVACKFCLAHRHQGCFDSCKRCNLLQLKTKESWQELIERAMTVYILQIADLTGMSEDDKNNRIFKQPSQLRSEMKQLYFLATLMSAGKELDDDKVQHINQLTKNYDIEDKFVVTAINELEYKFTQIAATFKIPYSQLIEYVSKPRDAVSSIDISSITIQDSPSTVVEHSN